jgi:HAD superfamily hydrolase (TIGR01549 family)
MNGPRSTAAVLFDWDGTLADSLAIFFHANEAVMGALGVPFDVHLYRRLYTPDWRIVYRRLGVPEERLEEANALWHEHFNARGAETQPLPGAFEALRRLARARLRLGLVTAGDRVVVEPQIERFGLDHLLTVCVYADDCPIAKPDPAPLRLALQRLGLAGRPERVVYVGDAPDDVRMARAVGAGAVGIASMLGDPDELVAAGAEVVAPSVADWVDEWLREKPRHHRGAEAVAPDVSAG